VGTRTGLGPTCGADLSAQNLAVRAISDRELIRWPQHGWGVVLFVFTIAPWRLSSALRALSIPTRSVAGKKRTRTESQSLKTAGGLLHRTSLPKRGVAAQELAERARAEHGLQASALSPRHA
jgi:hypothetical protein